MTFNEMLKLLDSEKDLTDRELQKIFGFKNVKRATFLPNDARLQDFFLCSMRASVIYFYWSRYRLNLDNLQDIVSEEKIQMYWSEGYLSLWYLISEDWDDVAAMVTHFINFVIKVLYETEQPDIMYKTLRKFRLKVGLPEEEGFKSILRETYEFYKVSLWVMMYISTNTRKETQDFLIDFCKKKDITTITSLIYAINTTYPNMDEVMDNPEKTIKELFESKKQNLFDVKLTEDENERITIILDDDKLKREKVVQLLIEFFIIFNHKLKFHKSIKNNDGTKILRLTKFFIDLVSEKTKFSRRSIESIWNNHKEFIIKEVKKRQPKKFYDNDLN